MALFAMAYHEKCSNMILVSGWLDDDRLVVRQIGP